MPYKLRRAPRTKTRKATRCWVVGPKGKHYSRDPIPCTRAEGQLRLLRAIERGWYPQTRKQRL